MYVCMEEDNLKISLALYIRLEFNHKTCAFQYDVTGTCINFETFQFDVDQFCVDSVLK